MDSPFAFGLEDLITLYGGVFFLPGHEPPKPTEPAEPGLKPLDASGVTKFSLSDIPLPKPKAESPKPPPALPQHTPPTPPTPAQAPQPSLVWLPKPNGCVTYSMGEAELKDKTLVELMKAITTKGFEIATSLVSFGKLLKPVGIADFDTQPTRYGVVFGSNWVVGRKPEANPLQTPSGKIVYVLPSLSEMVANVERKKEAWALIKTFRKEILRP